MTEQSTLHEHAFTDDRPFASCHASTLLELDCGDTLVAYFAGSHEKNPDVGIWLSRRTLAGWEPPAKVADFEGVAHWNPALFAAPDGTLWLFYKVGRLIPDWQTYVVTSADNGRTWTDPRELVPGDIGGRGPVKNKPLVLSDGAWLAGASHEGAAGWLVFVDRSADGGRTWQRSDYVPLRAGGDAAHGAIHPTLWESQPGQVHMLTRSNFGQILRADSEDGGRTWCPVYPSGLPNNNSGLDLTKLPDGTLVLACTPVWMGQGNPQPRTPLVLLSSADNGFAWRREVVLEDAQGEYSYPAVITVPDGVAVSYTWNRERVAYYRDSSRFARRVG